MSFFERYARICAGLNLDPCSQKAAEMIGIARATISIWNTKNKTPVGETVAAIANALHVSTDYLLGRTDDPTDWTDKKYSRKKLPAVIDSYDRLDEADQGKVEAYIDGMLATDKYSLKKRA